MLAHVRERARTHTHAHTLQLMATVFKGARLDIVPSDISFSALVSMVRILPALTLCINVYFIFYKQHACVCESVCRYACPNVCIRACVLACVRACVSVLVCACVRACVCPYVCIRACIRACVHMHVCLY